VTDKKHNLIDQKLQELNEDGIDRRGFLKCMAWAGTGLLWTGGTSDYEGRVQPPVHLALEAIS
jgi:hypothetical protein